MPRPGSAPSASPLSSGAPARPGDTRRVPGCLHSPPEWPRSASSPALGPAPAVPGYLRRHGRTPASVAGFVGRSPCFQGSLPGDAQRPSPPRPSPGVYRQPGRSRNTTTPPVARSASACPGLCTLRYSQPAFACSSSCPFRRIALSGKPQRKRRRNRRPFPYGLLLIGSARFAPTGGCAWYQWLCCHGSGQTASSGIGPGL